MKKKKNIMEMTKSCVVNDHIHDTDMFYSTPKSLWYGDEHWSNKTKITKYLQKQKQDKKHTVKNHTNIKNTFKTLFTSCTSEHIYCVSGDSKVWLSNKKRDKHWAIFTRYFLVMQNVVDMSFCVVQKVSSKPEKCIHAKTTENWYLTRIHMICINIKNCDMIRDFKNNNIKYMHDIFSSTRITNWKHEKQKATFTSCSFIDKIKV